MPSELEFRDGEDDAFAYVISIPPPETYNTGNATYDLAGFTPPAVLGDGASVLGAPGAVTGALTVDFGAGQVGLNINVPFANGSYALNSSGLGMYSRDGYNGSASGYGEVVDGPGQPFFRGPLTVNGSGVACDGAACSSGFAAGNVFGPRADGAALGYHIKDTSTAVDSQITGAAVFQQKTCVSCDVVPE